MKTIIASLALAFASLTVSVAADNSTTTHPEKPAGLQTAVYPSKNADKINVVIGKAAGTKAQIRLLTSDGEVLSVHQVSKKSSVVHTRFDVTELADGQYVVEISNAAGKEVKKVDLSTPKRTVERLMAVR